MISIRRYLPIFLISSCLTSCKVNKNLKVIRLEIMEPGIFDLPENRNTIAIFNRDLYNSDTCIFKYFNGLKTVADSSIKYNDFSNQCVDALSDFLLKQGYFQNVINYRDSLDFMLIHDRYKAEEYFEKSKADVCVFLNYYRSKMWISSYRYNINIKPALYWSIVFKDDFSPHLYEQSDELNFSKLHYVKLFHKYGIKVREVMNQASKDLGILFGTRLIPVWEKAGRIYYRSKNHEMLRAEKFAINNDWLKAAEIWNRKSTSENPAIAGKACYNMALVCEMEGKLDIAIDWLNKSKLYPINDFVGHQLFCNEYITILSGRKVKIESLKKQVR